MFYAKNYKSWSMLHNKIIQKITVAWFFGNTVYF